LKEEGKAAVVKLLQVYENLKGTAINYNNIFVS
jgi:hypothetical protein